MSNQNKGFDPLSSLFFDIPDPSEGVPFDDDFEDDGDRTVPIPGGHVDMTDPVFSPPPDMPAPPISEEVLEVTIHTDELSASEARNIITPPIPDRPARRGALARPPRVEPTGPSAADQAAIAKAVAAAAIAKMKAAAAPVVDPASAEPSAADQAVIAKAVAAAAIAKAAAPKPEGPTAADQAAIAKAVAASAIAKAKAASAKPAKPAKRVSRLAGLTNRASRPVNALEAARAAGAAEEVRRADDLKRQKAEDAATNRAVIAKAVAAAAIEKARAAAAPRPEEPSEEQTAIAKAVAAAAIARAKAAAAPQPDEPSAANQAAIARAVAAAAIAKMKAEVPTPAAPSASEQATIAKAVAAAAIAKAQGATPEPAKAPSAKPMSRMEALAARARRPQNALEAAREASRRETQAAEERQADEIRRKASALTDKIQELIPAWLPGVGTFYVANAIVTDERDVLKVLWKAHRAKFLNEGRLERAVSVASVLHALGKVGQGELVAAHVVTDASDYLLWMDLGSESLVAAFADARAWFVSRS
ncbi:MAG: hypothetical protein ACI8RZ_005979 [Myxococcota bacterium]|jgi:hypothetical protein